MNPFSPSDWVGAAAGGIMSYIGGERANANARQMQANAHAFSSNQSSTAWQRGIADMEAAGINPMLAVTQGSASSPSGGSAPQQDTISPAVSSSMMAGRYRKEQELLDAQIRDTRAEAKYKEEGKFPINRMFEDLSRLFEKMGIPRDRQEAFWKGLFGSSAKGSSQTPGSGSSAMEYLKRVLPSIPFFGGK